ncbi:MAG TPA: MarR family transcriptional regulator [Thermomonospora sp.]|nr:MarR family transcriptional regulator [Thermomonospora sp.]
MSATPDPDYDEVLLRFVERFAMLLHDIELPRMPARVFAYVLADDAESYTIAELAEGLRVSPAAVSTAVRHLVQIGLLGRERRPGTRTDHYRVYDNDVWSAITLHRMPVFDRYEECLAEGVALLGTERPGGRRILETLEYYRFLRAETPHLVERWKEYRRRHGLGADGG